ncbi:hypothetical protein [Vibrio phage 2 TSL-2019]|uniref:Uncharacterized protein n=1 Tax=Vibrio phage 2 TSL-2019 TaxID=2508172 RepID=A0A513PWD3_9CAUD|nr:hypothetical protein HWC03_gp074 [Vibrio phage 2 TSL-2019]QAU04229.1 hypothetical protein [Vibrio phage 2 TSL-2019]
MSERIKPPPSFAPAYCAMYPELVKIARQHGWALTILGSMARDFDMVCVPWTESPHDPECVVNGFCDTFSLVQIGQPDISHHGRLRFTLSVGWGECFLDLSFMPRSGDAHSA